MITSTRLLTSSGRISSTLSFSSSNLISESSTDSTLVVKTIIVESCLPISWLTEHSGMKVSWIFVTTFSIISETFDSSWSLQALSEILRMSKLRERTVRSSEYQPDFVELKIICYTFTHGDLNTGICTMHKVQKLGGYCLMTSD